MQNLYKFSCVFILMLISTTINAFTCQSSYRGWQFYSAGIGASGDALCNYRYCYYGCMYDSYTLEGCYKPGSGPWETEDNKTFYCLENNSDCQFKTASCKKI